MGGKQEYDVGPDEFDVAVGQPGKDVLDLGLRREMRSKFCVIVRSLRYNHGKACI